MLSLQAQDGKYQTAEQSQETREALSVTKATQLLVYLLKKQGVPVYKTKAGKVLISIKASK